MLKGPIRLLALLALALGAAFAVPAIASANTIPTHLGFCKKSEVGTTKVVGGHTYRCTTVGEVNEWMLIPTPPAPSASASAAPTPTVSPTTPPTDVPPSLTAAPTTPSPTAGALPVTGAKEDVMAGAGVALLLAGAGGVLYGRRKRTRFEA